MKRCLQIAKNGLGTARPNPMVGAIVVHNNTIIGEGFTSPYGGPHAEVNAIHSVKNKELLEESTLYVTLEPCSHYGKTPPCSDLIIEHKIHEVVIGCVDDNPEVSGKGIAQLKASGCRVTVGILEEECKWFHRRFFTFHNKQRPYIILKWAETSDRYLAPESKHQKQPVWITNTYSRQLVHKWRAEEQAILVGTNTVMEDNPGLTVRDWTGQNPLRLVLDKNRKLNEAYKLLSDYASKTVIFHGKTTDNAENKSIEISCLESDTTDLFQIEIDWSEPKTIASQICNVLYVNDINSVIVEGGSRTLQSFIDADLWDEARIFVGTSQFEAGVPAPIVKGHLSSCITLMEDTLKIMFNT